MEDRMMRAGGETCPCGKAKFFRFARCSEKTDYLNIHYDKCSACDFQTYAHNDYSIKLERYNKWLRRSK